MIVFPYQLATSTVDVQVGAGSGTWNLSLFSRDSVRAAMDSLVVWCNSASRPWYGSATFSWRWIDDGAGGAKVQLVSTAAFQLKGNGANPLLWPSAYATAAKTVTATAAAPGTWAPTHGTCALGRWMRQVVGRADGTGTETARPDVPGAAPIRPTLTAVCSTAALARLHELLLAAPARKVQVWHALDATWRTVVIGQVERAAAGRTHWRVTLDCRGVP